jgi:uncharacterized protein (TIGR01244 family)
MAVEEIRNYRRVDDRVATGGQPTEEQLADARKVGFEAIVNLAPATPDNAMRDEAAVVGNLGMEYHHIPVDWDNPTEDDLDRFFSVMGRLAEKRTLVHCAANYRVSVFYSLYALQAGRWSKDDAMAFIRSIWNPEDYPAWWKFLSGALAKSTR